MQHPTKSTRRSKLLATGAMALTLAIGGGLAASHSAFAADSSSGTSTSSQTQAQDQTSAGKTFRGGHFGQRGGSFFGLGAYQDKLAAYLNLDAETLKTKLQTQTLAEIAADQNVDRETLKAQLVAWIDAAKPAASADSAAADGTSSSAGSGQARPAIDSSTLAEKLLDSKGGIGDRGQGGRVHGGKGFGIDQEKLATALGLTADQLKEAAQSGKTLAEIAAAQNIDRETLKEQLVAWIEAAKPADAPAASDSSDASATGKPAFDVSAIADKLLDSPYGWAGKGDHKGFGGLRVLESADVASALGVTADELKAALQSGQSVSEVAADKGVDVQKAIDAVSAALKNQLDQQLSDGKITQDEYDSRSADLAKKASAIVNGKRGQGGRGFPGQAPQPSDQAQADNNTTDGSSE
ncbi:hypothetical protein H7B90_24060 [Cohnella xylanilytica]|uniref:Oligomerization/nucleic acid binding protein n=1 Tax=Cohnella xylanilytica TaxID=557555 RepID=A0A841U886_9BACL|nr:hypothetical protein [Cohnella xylanilytica]MBB6694473.1 hypothetical protein [Cohnella xylanilytica]